MATPGDQSVDNACDETVDKTTAEAAEKTNDANPIMTVHSTVGPQAAAERMMVNDRVAQALSMEVLEVGEGFARVSMQVRNDMLNGFSICHGGIIFTLADTAFAYACNSRNRKTVALNCVINFMNAVFEGDRLTATASEVFLGGRTGIYDVTVRNQNGVDVAEFRGTSYGTSGQVVSS